MVGPVTQSDRRGTTELLRRSVSGNLPKGTTAIEVALVLATKSTNFDGPNAPRVGFDRAEADNLSLDLSAPVRRPTPPGPPQATVPRFDHVFLFTMENQDFSSIIGNTRKAPYINSLLSEGSLLANMYAEEHPSDANYLAMAGGSAFGLPLTDPLEINPRYTIDAKNIGDTIVGAHEAWKGYLQSANGPCDDTVHNQYWDDDLPFLYFKDIRERPAYCSAHVTPLTELTTDLKRTSTTPNFSWIGPDDCFDMEGCGRTAGDTFLRKTMSKILQSPAWTEQRSLLILTWDEDGYDQERPAQLIPTIVLGSKGVKRGYVSSRRYTHYSLLRTVEAALGLPTLTKNDLYATPMNDVFDPSIQAQPTIARRGSRLPAKSPPRPATGPPGTPTRPDPAQKAGSTAYVANSFSGTVTPIDTATNTAGKPIRVGAHPQAVVVTPNGRTAYVANWGSGTVSPIDTSTNTAGTPIVTGSYPFAIAVTPNGRTAYVANYGSNDVTPIDTATNTAGPRISTGRQPDAIAFGAGGHTAFVVNADSDSVTPIDTATNRAATAIAVGYSPSGIAVGPGGKTAYVVSTISGTVTPIDTATDRSGTPISVGRYRYPLEIVMTPGGATAEVVDTYAGKVTPIDTRTNRAGKPIAVGSYPVAIAIEP